MYNVLKSIRRYYRLDTPNAWVFVIKFKGSAATHVAVFDSTDLDAFSLSDCSQCVWSVTTTFNIDILTALKTLLSYCNYTYHIYTPYVAGANSKSDSS